MANITTLATTRLAHTTPGLQYICAGYNPNGGVKGSLRYMVIDHPATGVYRAKFKNFIGNPLNPTSITQGTVVTDYSKIVGLEVSIEYANLGATGLASNLYRSISVNVNDTDNCIYIYTRDTAGNAANISSGDVIQIVPYFTNGVTNFGNTILGNSGGPITTGRDITLVNVYIDTTDMENPTLVNAPEGSTVTNIGQDTYQLFMPYSTVYSYVVFGTIAVAKNSPVSSDVYFNGVSGLNAGINYTVAVRSNHGLTTAGTYKGIYASFALSNSETVIL